MTPGTVYRPSLAGPRIHRQVAQAYDFSRFEVIADVGGGTGQMLMELLRVNPCLAGILIERPTVAEIARHAFDDVGLAGRTRIVSGDFFSDMPGGADVYILSNVLRDWDDANAVLLLLHCATVMRRDTVLLVVERLVPWDHQSSRTWQDDLLGLVTTGGRARSEPEFDRLFADAGLKQTRRINLRAGYSLFEVRKVDIRED